MVGLQSVRKNRNLCSWDEVSSTCGVSLVAAADLLRGSDSGYAQFIAQFAVRQTCVFRSSSTKLALGMCCIGNRKILSCCWVLLMGQVSVLCTGSSLIQEIVMKAVAASYE